VEVVKFTLITDEEEVKSKFETALAHGIVRRHACQHRDLPLTKRQASMRVLTICEITPPEGGSFVGCSWCVNSKRDRHHAWKGRVIAESRAREKLLAVRRELIKKTLEDARRRKEDHEQVAEAGKEKP
jgi:predicted GNAT family N-acyltransferase